MHRLVWFWSVLLLLSTVSALFEWVHPDEWQPEATTHGIAEDTAEFLREKTGEMKEKVKDTAHRAGEAVKEAGASLKEGTKELGEDINERFQSLRKQSKEHLYEPMVRMMKHALNVFEEEDKYMEDPILSIRHGWPSRFETNPRLWREYPDEYLLFLDVPGIPRNDISCNITRNHLVISGHHGSCLRPAKTAEGEERFCVERAVMETIRIPEDVNADKLECKFKDGVIIAKMPKMAVQGKRIPVHEYVPSWSERAKDAKDAVLEKIGVRHEHVHGNPD